MAAEARRIGQIEHPSAEEKDMPDKGRQAKAFVIMPFSPEFDAIYGMFIRDALERAGLEVFRADDIRSQRNIINDVVSSIANSDLIIADLTNSNPNVFYELGLAHALQKPVILLTQDLEEVPFDLKSYRLLTYTTHFATISKQREELYNYAIDFLDGKLLFGNPVTDFFSGGPVLVPELGETREGLLDGDNLERGFLDHIEDLEIGYSRIAEIITTMNNEMVEVRDASEEAVLQWKKAGDNPSAGRASFMKKVARRLAERLHISSSRFTAANDEYSTLNRSLENSLEFVVAFQVQVSEDERRALPGQISQLSEFRETAVSGRDTLLGLATTIAQVPRIERHLTRAMGELEEQIRRTADLIDQTVAEVTRALNVAEGVLDYPPVLGSEDSLEPGWDNTGATG